MPDRPIIVGASKKITLELPDDAEQTENPRVFTVTPPPGCRFQEIEITTGGDMPEPIVPITGENGWKIRLPVKEDENDWMITIKRSVP